MIDQIFKDVKEKFKNHPKRYEHILGVCQKAVELADFYNLDKEKAYIAALFHDYLKYDSIDIQKNLLKDNDLRKCSDNEVLCHAFSAAVLIKEKYNIKDLDIINAIKYHVFGDSLMNDLAKVILLADKTETSRDYPEVNKIRDLSFKNLNQAVIYFLESNKKYLVEMGYKMPENIDITISTLKEEKV